MRLFGAAKAAWRWKEPKRLTEGVQGVRAIPPSGGSDMSGVRRHAVGTVATVARRGNSGAELELGYRGIGRSVQR